MMVRTIPVMGRKRRSVGQAISLEIRRETMRRAMELVIYLLLYEPVSLVPVRPAIAHGIAEADGDDDMLGVPINDRFGHSYWMIELPNDGLPDWDAAYQEYLTLAERFMGFPIQDREELLGAMISGVCAQGDWPETELGEDPPLVRLYDLAEPLGFSPIDVSARMHTCRMRMLEFEVAG